MNQGDQIKKLQRQGLRLRINRKTGGEGWEGSREFLIEVKYPWKSFCESSARKFEFRTFLDCKYLHEIHLHLNPASGAKAIIRGIRFLWVAGRSKTRGRDRRQTGDTGYENPGGERSTAGSPCL